MKLTLSKFLVLCGPVLLLVAVPVSRAQTSPAASAERSANRLSEDDRDFLQKAARLNQEELVVARVGLNRSTNAEVREFAQKLIDDHQSAEKKLDALAQRKGADLRPSADMTEDLNDLRRKWNEQDVADFDEAFIETQVDMHEDTIDAFEGGTECEDADIAAFARETLPTLRAHLRRAQTLEEKVRS